MRLNATSIIITSIYNIAVIYINIIEVFFAIIATQIQTLEAFSNKKTKNEDICPYNKREGMVDNPVF
uniref:Uncharacterized protein n=1 Tax=Pseudoalteromonas citrea DSM 8771 TaxID=1117314 RepID=U1KK26_9GAMM